MFKLNPVTQIDFYKTGHKDQYPDGTTLVYSNFTPRSSRLAKVLKDIYDDKVVFFGLQGFIKWFLIDTWNESFFKKPKDEVVARYKRRMDTSLGPNAVDVKHIEALHDLGYLPIKIKAMPEGSRVDIKIPMFTIENTLPGFFWLTNYLETVLSAEVWKPCTVATIAFEYRKLLDLWADKTGSPKEFVQFQGHDFSFRGMSGMHDAATSNAGHLLSFVGTDTIPAIDYLEDYYNADAEKELIGTSVPATEHSVMCMGTKDDEIGTFRRLITELYPTGIVSIVSDTWDFWKVINEYTITLKEEILNRTPNALGLAKVVFRPDSGNPVNILTGYKVINEDNINALWGVNSELANLKAQGYEAIRTIEGDIRLIDSYETILSEAEAKGAVECLWDIFGGTETEKGFKVLHERVGLIYGDSITLERAAEILKRLSEKGFASCNIVFGIGSYTYQYNTRDTFGFAMKATYGEVKGEPREIFKDPVTDNGTKRSARGLLCVYKWEDAFYLKDSCPRHQEERSLMQTVFSDGNLLIDQSLSEIRLRLMLS